MIEDTALPVDFGFKTMVNYSERGLKKSVLNFEQKSPNTEKSVSKGKGFLWI